MCSRSHYIRPLLQQRAFGPLEVSKQQRMENKTSASSSEEATTAEQTERSYAHYTQSADLAFDPMKELNLPESYEEVTSRFRRLQGSRAMEVLN